ncbi:MAG: RluA family pseudouridine synthase [Clostridiales bacterium]|nr:RluA family pseudouridine synthase [Clostridiales bacterium]
MNNKTILTSNKDGIRIDTYLPEVMEEMSRSYAQKLIADGRVLVNNCPIKAKYKLKIDDVITVEIPEVILYEAKAQDIPVEIIYEDDHIIVVNKARGMVVHPAPGNHDGTLVNALLFHCNGRLSSINGVERPGIVHRIDKDTSGILVVAKTDTAHRFLGEKFAEHNIDREYIAAVRGIVSENGARIEAPIGRHPTDRKKMAVNTRNGKYAVTHFNVEKRYRKATLIKARLETGRTHQIRVHLSYIGHPVIGDETYGGAKSGHSIKGQALHAAKLGFEHPDTGEKMNFEAQPPEEFKLLLEELENE